MSKQSENPNQNSSTISTHTAGHDRHGNTLVRACVALNAADVVDQPCVGEKILRHELGAERVTGHEDGLGKIGGGGFDVGGGVEMTHGIPPGSGLVSWFLGGYMTIISYEKKKIKRKIEKTHKIYFL